jgi:hypothetical protein
VARRKAKSRPNGDAPSRAILLAALDGIVFQEGDRTQPLGYVEGLTGHGFRLICEDGTLLLVAQSDKPLNATLVREIETRCDWIRTHRNVVDARWLAVEGTPPPPVFEVRVVVTGRNATLEERLCRLPVRVQLRILSLTHTGDGWESSYKDFALGAANEGQPGIDSLLLEARYAARNVLQKDLPRDPYDWRTSKIYNLIRVYGLLVTAASSLTVLGARSVSNSTRRSRPPANAFLQLRDKLLPILGRFADYVACGNLKPSTPTVRKDLRLLCELIETAYGKGICSGHSSGAYISPAWHLPVPRNLREVLSGMLKHALPATPIARLTIDSSGVADILADRNAAIACAIHLGQTFDDVAYPPDTSTEDKRYVRAVLARLLSAHRVLLELLATDNAFSVIGLSSLALDISSPPCAYGELFTGSTEDDHFLVSARHRSLAVLRKGTRLPRHGGKSRACSLAATSQERSVMQSLTAMVMATT